MRGGHWGGEGVVQEEHADKGPTVHGKHPMHMPVINFAHLAGYPLDFLRVGIVRCELLSIFCTRLLLMLLRGQR